MGHDENGDEGHVAGDETPEGPHAIENGRDVHRILLNESGTLDHHGRACLTYEDFVRARTAVAEHLGNKFAECFRPKVFLRLAQNGSGTVLLETMTEYVQRHAILVSQMQHLARHDLGKGGNLDARGLEDFLESIDLFGRQDIVPSIIPVATRIGVLKLLFYHGNKEGRVRVSDMLVGHTIMEIQKVQTLLDEGAPEEVPSNNWFSRQNVEIIHGTFLQLDRSMSGRLSPDDFLSYTGAKMTKLFVNRVFEEHGGLDKDGKPYLDMDGFTKFIVAWRDRATHEAIKYLFQIFDLRKQGYLTSLDVFAFAKEITKLWLVVGETPYPQMTEDIVDEIFDMVRPEVPGRIYIRDLQATGTPGLIFGVLGDVWEFWHHEHREDQANADPEGEGD